MTTQRLFRFDDVFKFNHIVLDPLVEVCSLSFVIPRILEHPDLAIATVAPDDRLMGFILGTRIVDEEEPRASHGHISALAVAPEYRRLGLGTRLMDSLRELLDRQKESYVDLFVRQKNHKAIVLYESLGYVKYRWLPQYYAPDHGYDMRLPLASDVQQRSLRGITKNKIYSFGNKIIYLVMLYLVGLRDILTGGTR